MDAVELKPGIHWVGTNDRSTDLFEGLWPITQEGISYNSYLIASRRKALIDLTTAGKADLLLDRISAVIDPRKLDVVVLNHMEPDHTGMIRTLRRVAPEAEIIASTKAAAMLRTFYGIENRVRAVDDGDTLPLGDHTLRFFSTPFVHWPETMMTFETSQRVLFPCDGFGGYGALQGALFDDQLRDLRFYEEEAYRYFVNVLAAYAKSVRRAIAKLAEISIDVVAPAHGLIWRSHPRQIIDLYDRWTERGETGGEPGVTLLFATMYGNTERMMDAVAEGIVAAGVPLRIFDVARTPISYVLPSLWSYTGVAVGAPTYEADLFPPAATVLEMARRKRIFGKRSIYFGSYGWGGGGEREMRNAAAAMRWNLLETLPFQAAPTEDELHTGRELGARLAKAVAGGAG